MLGKLAVGEFSVGEFVTGEIVLGKLCWGNDLTPHYPVFSSIFLKLIPLSSIQFNFLETNSIVQYSGQFSLN